MKIISPQGNLNGVFPEEKIASLLLCRFQGETVGAFWDIPPHSITDVYTRTKDLLQKGRVMILYIDGLGYDLYKRAELPFIKQTFSCVCSRTAFPPLTQPCMASMLTGVWPDAHGVLSRRHHRPMVPSLLITEGAVLVEGDSAPLALEKHPILTLPKDGETVDSAVLRAAMPHAAGDTPLLIVHFHGLDDMEHDVGDDEICLREKLLELDRACQSLCSVFRGSVILCSDHGVHSENGAGFHGAFDYRDMFIPYGEASL